MKVSDCQEHIGCIVGGHAGYETSGCVHPEIGTLTDLLGQEVRGTQQHADLPGSTNLAITLEIVLEKANHAEA
jgi:hypothetical protein